MKGLFLAFALLLTGCATPSVVNVPDIDKSQSIAVKDMRPATEKENKIFSLVITNDAYGTYRRGDTDFKPAPLRLFQHRVYEKLGQSLSSPQLTVYHFATYWNIQRMLRRSAVSVALGGVGGAIIFAETKKGRLDPTKGVIEASSFDALSGKDEYMRAIATQSENPKNEGAFIVYIDAEINGRRLFIRSVSAASSEGNQNAEIAAVEDAISFFLDQYQAQ